MQLVLGDVKWLTENLPRLGRNTEMTILVTNGKTTQELPILSAMLDKKLVILCGLPLADSTPQPIKKAKRTKRCKA